jgi:hypothetical protein
MWLGTQVRQSVQCLTIRVAMNRELRVHLFEGLHCQGQQPSYSDTNWSKDSVEATRSKHLPTRATVPNEGSGRIVRQNVASHEKKRTSDDVLDLTQYQQCCDSRVM